MTHENVRRAPYALPEGVPALQEDPHKSRRTFLAALLLALTTGATAGFSAGLGLGGPASISQIAHRQDPQAAVFSWAEALALAPDDQLLRDRERFLNVVESQTPSAKLWDGVHRLATQTRNRDPQLLDRLRDLLDSDGIPKAVHQALEDSLEERRVPPEVETR